ncbi:MAG: type II toxin-antitoxin system VapC family toxin [Bifidobacteriaceae bacterium]|jgi:predicted nucleic acid-binding protein|nr:type II toxin-antitoxin system VapC family toxin [Bifidobacteriaceae bacterium]
MSLTALIDSNVPIYALGGDHPEKAPCLALLRAAGAGQLRGIASAEMIQELIYHRLRVTSDRSLAVRDGRDAAALFEIMPFDAAVLEVAMRLIERTASIRGRDAVHAATALVGGVDTMISTDPAFAAVPGLKWLDPAAAVKAISAQR